MASIGNKEYALRETPFLETSLLRRINALYIFQIAQRRHIYVIILLTYTNSISSNIEFYYMKHCQTLLF